MSTPREQRQSPAEALGCGLLLMGALGAAFGLAALLGVSDRIELEFFGIALNDPPGRRIWTAVSIAAVVAGLLILRKRTN